jgi:magnesium transporter
MLRLIAGKEGKEIREEKPENITALLNDQELLWLDIIKPSKEDLSLLKNYFNVHQLTVEDALQPFHLPKIESFDQYIFVVWQVLNDNPETDEIENSQISFVLGEKFLITIHHDAIPIIDDLEKQMLKGDCTIENCSLLRGTDWVMRSILDKSTDGYFPIVDAINDRSDDIEDLIFENADQKQLKELFDLKRKLLQIRKVVSPQRDAITELVRFEKYVKPENIAYFRDIFDRLLRILDLVDSARDIISGSMDIYLSAVSNRLNEIMKKLTIVATIVLPLSLVTGIYGMNFRFMPELHSRYGYFTVLASMVIFSVVMFIYFKKKNWW